MSWFMTPSACYYKNFMRMPPCWNMGFGGNLMLCSWAMVSHNRLQNKRSLLLLESRAVHLCQHHWPASRSCLLGTTSPQGLASACVCIWLIVVFCFAHMCLVLVSFSNMQSHSLSARSQTLVEGVTCPSRPAKRTESLKTSVNLTVTSGLFSKISFYMSQILLGKRMSI